MQKKLFVFILMAIMLVMIAGCAPGTIAKVNTPVPNAKSGTPAPTGEITVPGVSIQIYAPGPNPLVTKDDANGHVAGVLLGLWHGIIAPVTLVLSFFNPDIQMYEVHNDGSQYNLGFLLGVAIFFVILGVFFSSRRR
jgi:hypothetical protein